MAKCLKVIFMEIWCENTYERNQLLFLIFLERHFFDIIIHTFSSRLTTTNNAAAGRHLYRWRSEMIEYCIRASNEFACSWNSKKAIKSKLCVQNTDKNVPLNVTHACCSKGKTEFTPLLYAWYDEHKMHYNFTWQNYTKIVFQILFTFFSVSRWLVCTIKIN